MTRIFNYFNICLIIMLAFATISFGQISFSPHLIRDNFEATMSVFGTDVDNDGDMDILGAGYEPNGGILWWQNDGEQNFTEHQISENFGDARTVYFSFINDDDYVDVLGASVDVNAITWWQNDENQNFSQYTIAANFDGAHTVYAADVDSDGDMDVLGAAWVDGFAWWENDGSQNFIAHQISVNAPGSCIYACPGANGVDVFGTVYAADGEIIWWQNDGNQNFNEVTISFPWVHWASAADLDSDGDLDIVGASCGSTMAWWENNGAGGFTQHTLSASFACAANVDVADLDADGDIDILGAGENVDDIRWWENIDGQNFSEHSIAGGDFSGASGVSTADVDGDGDNDVLGAGNRADEIRWYENDLFNYDFGAETTTGHAPLTIQFTDLSNPAQPIIAWSWDFNNDGTIDSEEQNPTWTYQSPGDYSVRLDVFYGAESETILREDYIHVFNGESALEFDGAGSYVSCPATPSLNFSEAITFEAWIDLTEWAELGAVVDKGNISLLINGQSGQFNNHSVAAWLATTGGPPGFVNSPENSIDLNECPHLALTYDGSNSEVKIYIDGVEQPLSYFAGQPSGNIADNSDIDLYVGMSSNMNWAFNGLIDEVRIWNVVRSEEEIQANMDGYLSGDEPGLVAYWQMNEGSGPFVFDITGIGNGGIINGAAWVAGCGGPLAVEGDPDNLAGRLAAFCLEQNYPNPFNPLTTIQYALPTANYVNLSIYDISGKLVKTLVSGRQEANKYSIQWKGAAANGRPVGSGVYLYRLQTDTIDVTKRMVLMK